MLKNYTAWNNNVGNNSTYNEVHGKTEQDN